MLPHFNGSPQRCAGHATPAPGAHLAWQLPWRGAEPAVADASVPQSAWWLQFGPDPGAAPRAIGGLCLHAMAARRLVCVQLWHQDMVVYQLDSRADERGNPLPAGDLLQGMSRMQGHDGLLIDASGLGLLPASTTLRLLLIADGRMALAACHVELLPLP